MAGWVGALDAPASGCVVVVSESPAHWRTHAVVAALEAAGHRARVEGGSIAADFGRLLLAPRLVASCSTFCWWAAVLGGAREVAYPLMGVLHTMRPRAESVARRARFVAQSSAVATESIARLAKRADANVPERGLGV